MLAPGRDKNRFSFKKARSLWAAILPSIIKLPIFL